MKNQLIMSIMTRTMKIVPIDIARQIQDILESELKDVDVSPSTTALVVYTGAPDCLRYYIASKRLQGLSEMTLTRYEQQVGRFLACMQKKVQDITELDVKAYLSAYRQAGAMISTADTLRATLNSFFFWLEGTGIIRVSPMRMISRFKLPSRKPKYLTRSQLEQLRCACRDARDRAILEAYYSTACRVSELQKADRDQLDLATGRLTVIGKGNKERTVLLSEQALIYVRAYLEMRTDNDAALFVTERAPHRRMSIKAIQSVFSRLGQTAGLSRRIHPHLMRHSRATHLLRANIPLDQVQQYLGHSNPSTTTRYAITSEEAVQAAVQGAA